MTRDSRVLREAKALSDVGHRVIIFGILDKNTIPIEKVDGFIIRRIPPRHSIFINMWKNLNSIMQDLIKRFIFKPIIWLVDPHYCPRTVEEAIKEKADVYHAHDLKTLSMAYIAARDCKAKLIYDSHELYVERNPKYTDHNPVFDFRLRRREANLIKKTDAVITVNESIASELSRRYRIRKPHIIMNAPPQIDYLNPLLLRQKLEDELQIHLPEKERIIIYIGGISENRGLEQVILSLHYLRKTSLIIMGYGHEGIYMNRLKAFAEKQGVNGKVYFLSPVPSDQVANYASGADVGVVPIQNICLSYYYCLPNKIFESIAANIPVAVSKLPELSHLVHEYGIGGTFNPDDPRDIASTIYDILYDLNCYEQMKERTRQAATLFNWKNESKKLVMIYKTLEEYQDD